MHDRSRTTYQRPGGAYPAFASESAVFDATTVDRLISREQRDQSLRGDVITGIRNGLLLGLGLWGIVVGTVAYLT